MRRTRSGKTRNRQKTGKSFCLLKFKMRFIESNHRYWLKLQELEHVVFFHSIWPNVFQRWVWTEICVFLLGSCSSQMTGSMCLIKWVMLQLIMESCFVLLVGLCCPPITNQILLNDTNVQLIWLACAGEQLSCKYIGNIETTCYVCLSPISLVVQCKSKVVLPLFLEAYAQTLWSKFRLACATGLKSVELDLVAMMLTWCYNDLMYQLELVSFRVTDPAPCYGEMCYSLE